MLDSRDESLTRFVQQSRAEGEAKIVEAKNALRVAEAELAALDAADEGIVFDPATPARYASALRDLVTSLATADGNPDNRARDAVRTLVSEIIISPAEDDGIPVEVRGRLSALISNSNFQVGGCDGSGGTFRAETPPANAL